jgi:antitoxin CptB
MEKIADRLKWKCRRGLLELDLVFQKYLEKHPEDESLFELLDLPDNDLWDIVSGRSEEYETRFKPVVARLRAA